MTVAEPIADDEVILRRIPPSKLDHDSTSPRVGGGLRAASFRMATDERKGEEGLSCTRLLQTSPQMLLADLLSDSIDPTGWDVCRLFVRDVRALGLDVIHKPTDRDRGHCEIVGKDQNKALAFPNTKSQKLAKRTRILTAEEVAALKAGDTMVD